MKNRKFKIGDTIQEAGSSLYYTIIEVNEETESYKLRTCNDYGEIDDEWFPFHYIERIGIVSKNKEIPENKKNEYKKEIDCNGILPKLNINMKLDRNVDKFKQIAINICDLYEKKNNAYGNAFSDTYKKLGIISAVTRISDKYNRLCNLAINSNIDNLGESIEDTLKDLAAYSIMTLMELDKKEF